MSYSFQIKAANKEAAKQAVAAKFEETIAQQPVHEHDKAAVLANANTVIDLLADDGGKDVAVSCNGYLSWNGGPDQLNAYTNASVSCTASHAVRT